MQKFLFDKEIVNNQLSVLNNTLASQRQTKKTLLSYLEKFSDAMYENFNSENTDSLLFLINEAHSIFECIKSNISKTIELKNFLENIYNSDFLNTIDSEKFTNEFNALLDNISKTNSNYLSFMNNYETFIKPPFINETSSTVIIEDDIKKEIIEEELILEEPVVDEPVIEESIVEEPITEEPIIEEPIIEEPIIKEPIIEEPIIEESIAEEPVVETPTIDEPIITEPVVSETTIDLAEPEEESLFETINTQNIEEEISNKSIVETVDEETIQESVTETITDEIKDEPIVETVKESKEQEKTTKKDFTIIEEPEDEHIEEIVPSMDLQEKELIINKELGIAILPYSISDLDELFLDDPEKYSSIQDIIDKEYTVKLKDFENSSIVRYKEAFKLAKDKSNYSFSQAVNFAKKLLVETEVTSLVIASCRNVEELDFYIECLNNNRLKDFHYFKIIEK